MPSFDGLIGDSLDLRNCALKYNSGHSAKAYSRVENRIKNVKESAPQICRRNSISNNERIILLSCNAVKIFGIDIRNVI